MRNKLAKKIRKFIAKACDDNGVFDPKKRRNSYRQFKKTLTRTGLADLKT